MNIASVAPESEHYLNTFTYYINSSFSSSVQLNSTPWGVSSSHIDLPCRFKADVCTLSPYSAIGPQPGAVAHTKSCRMKQAVKTITSFLCCENLLLAKRYNISKDHCINLTTKHKTTP